MLSPAGGTRAQDAHIPRGACSGNEPRDEATRATGGVVDAYRRLDGRSQRLTDANFFFSGVLLLKLVACGASASVRPKIKSEETLVGRARKRFFDLVAAFWLSAVTVESYERVLEFC